MPRRTPGAVLEDPDAIADRVLAMVLEGRLEAIDGTVLDVAPESVCLHGDTPGAVAMARAVRGRLVEAGVRLEAFAPDRAGPR